MLTLQFQRHAERESCIPANCSHNVEITLKYSEFKDGTCMYVRNYNCLIIYFGNTSICVNSLVFLK